MKAKCVVCHKVKVPGEGRPFHRFPSADLQKRIWLSALNIPSAPKSALVCCNHFDARDYIVARDGGRRLKPDAVPNLLGPPYASSDSTDSEDDKIFSDNGRASPLGGEESLAVSESSIEQKGPESEDIVVVPEEEPINLLELAEKLAEDDLRTRKYDIEESSSLEKSKSVVIKRIRFDDLIRKPKAISRVRKVSESSSSDTVTAEEFEDGDVLESIPAVSSVATRENPMTSTKRNQKSFVIAEIGQNHQGDISIAKQLIKAAKDCGADCVKFQKTCREEKFTKSALETPYDTRNSWGKTYGEHKAFLEFSEEEFYELQTFSKELGILFTASAMDEKSMEFLASMNVPFLKIGSGDANNLILIEKAARIGIFLVISTGMQDFQTVQKIYQTLSKHHKKFALLHCVSAYPTPYEDVNLKVINLYQKEFPDIIIGYSGHELGIHVTLAAVALGAKIIERHITLDKSQKGSDHKCSLTPVEFKELIDAIRIIELALGRPVKTRQPSEISCYEKLGKSLVFAKNLKKGHTIQTNDLKVKVSKPKGMDCSEMEDVLGKILSGDVNEDFPVLVEHFI